MSDEMMADAAFLRFGLQRKSKPTGEARVTARPQDQPPRSVWCWRINGGPWIATTSRVIADACKIGGFQVQHYVLPPKRAKKARKSNMGIVHANTLLMRDKRFREMLAAKPKRRKGANHG